MARAPVGWASVRECRSSADSTSGRQDVGQHHDQHEHVLGARDSADLILPGRILGEQHRSGLQVPHLPIAGLDRARSG